MILKTYSGETLKVLGKTEVSVKLDSQESNLPLYVVEGNGPLLLGKNWLSTVKLNWGLIKHGSSDLDQVNNKHSSLFDKSMGCLKGTQAKLNLKEGTTPKFRKVRSVPYALRETIEQELDNLVKKGVLERVEYSEWASPNVPVVKSDGSVRLCGDYKVTCNPHLEVDQHPLPKQEDLFVKLSVVRSLPNLIFHMLIIRLK